MWVIRDDNIKRSTGFGARAKLRKLSGRSLNTSSTNTEPLELGSATLLPAKSPT